MTDSKFQLGTSGYVWSRSDSGSGFRSTEGFSDCRRRHSREDTSTKTAGAPDRASRPARRSASGSDDISNQDVEPTFKFIWSYDLGQGWGLYGNLGVAYP